jgi:hypothetical protein
MAAAAIAGGAVSYGVESVFRRRGSSVANPNPPPDRLKWLDTVLRIPAARESKGDCNYFLARSVAATNTQPRGTATCLLNVSKSVARLHGSGSYG